MTKTTGSQVARDDAWLVCMACWYVLVMFFFVGYVFKISIIVDGLFHIAGSYCNGLLDI